MTTKNCKTILTMPALPENQNTTAMMPLMLKRIKKTMPTQQKILFWSSKILPPSYHKVLSGDVVKHFSDVLREYLSGFMEGIYSCLCIHPNMKNIISELGKCFNPPGYYPKGNGTEFKHWFVTYHPYSQLYPVEITTGARNYMVIEGAVSAYTNAWLYKLFLDKVLSTLDAYDILQENLFIILFSVEMVSLSRLMSILHFSINVPIRWLTGNTHTLCMLVTGLSSLWAGQLIVCTTPC